VRRADLFDLDGEGASFDVVTASLFLHHCPAREVVRALRAMDRLAARGLILSDLLRSRAGYWAVGLLSHLIGNAVVRHDGPLSVRRAFRPEELEALAAEAGLPHLSVRVHPWFRVSLAGTKA
jgi:2-polyprenyl-3-methyl-5-hydroxy-6-metoxy-1,4-benzoquinol methylase